MQEIYDELKRLRLPGMADCWRMLGETHKTESLTLKDGLSMLLQSERDQRFERRTDRLIKSAKFRYLSSIEEVIFDNAKGREEGKIMQLSTCDYIKQGVSVLVTGASGVGKSFIVTALGYQACFGGYKVSYFNMMKLLETIQLARIESSIAHFFDKMATQDLLIIDDFGMKKLDGQQLMDFMEIVEDRHGRHSTIISSQLPVSEWYNVLSKNETIADAIMDRLVKTSHRLELKGDSFRK